MSKPKPKEGGVNTKLELIYRNFEYGKSNSILPASSFVRVINIVSLEYITFHSFTCFYNLIPIQDFLFVFYFNQPLFIYFAGIGWKSWKKRWFILTRTSLVFFKSDPVSVRKVNAIFHKSSAYFMLIKTL